MSNGTTTALRDLGTACVLGLFWGDEGKGKIVDLLTEHADIVVRYNGGANAGHTVVVEDEKFALHLIPCGALHEGKIGIIGPGVALDPKVLLDELKMLRSRGVAVDDRFKISNRCHLVMPYHRLEDQLQEASLPGDRKIGTTARGIGPCYADKMQRSSALRLCDLLDSSSFEQRLRMIVQRKNRLFAGLYDHNRQLDADEIAVQYLGFAEAIRPLVADTTLVLRESRERGRRLLFEGAHGLLLDIDHGTYPYVTSSSALDVGSGSGASPVAVDNYIGVVKAYCTRVGQGPFPTELQDAIGDSIRESGREFGTTTGRPRRIGWFDAFAGRYAVELGGIRHVSVMHLDTLSGLDEIKVANGYELDGRLLEAFPADARTLERVTPRYETLPGWHEDISSVRRFDDLPVGAQSYILRLEALIGARVSVVSVGPDRRQTIIR